MRAIVRYVQVNTRGRYVIERRKNDLGQDKVKEKRTHVTNFSDFRLVGSIVRKNICRRSELTEELILRMSEEWCQHICSGDTHNGDRTFLRCSGHHQVSSVRNASTISHDRQWRQQHFVHTTHHRVNCRIRDHCHCNIGILCNQ